MNLRDQLAAIFSPTRRLAEAGGEGALVRAGGALGGVQWVVPRSRLAYRQFELPNVPARQRDGAARIAARRVEAQPGARFHVAWTGSTAHVWSWDPGEAAPDDAEASWIPESLLRMPPREDGLRLLAQVEGFEGQSWRGGELQASHWWPDTPGAVEWARFARGAGYGPGPEHELPAADVAAWSEPWGQGSGRGLGGSPAMLERWGWIAVSGVVLLALGWQLAALLSWSIARAQLDAQLEDLRAEATPLLVARERAEAARDALLSLHDLLRGHDDYRLMAEVIDPLPPDTRLKEWQRDDESLSVVVSSAQSDPRQFIAAYEGHPKLAGVVATPLPDATMGLAFELPSEVAP